MKKLTARLTLVAFSLGLIVYIVMELYVAPIKRIGANNWWDYIWIVITLTLAYSIIALLVILVLRIIKWAEKNA